VLVYLSVYVAWPALLSGSADRLLDGEIQASTIPRNATLPFHHVYAPNEAGLLSIACERSAVDPAWLRCRLRTTPESFAQIHDGVDAIEGWRAEWSVRDLRIHAGLTPWPLVNESLQWLIPIAVLAVLARWPSRRDLQATKQALRVAPWILILPLAFGATAAAAIVVRGGSPALRDLEWHGFLVAPFLLGPLQEELLFRGFAYDRLARTGLTAAARGALISIAFVAIHTPQLASPTFWIAGLPVAVGLFWIRHRHDSLALCIVVHGLTNVVLHHIASGQP
jgi:membrane protease YdiL (CAAX protease family)